MLGLEDFQRGAADRAQKETTTAKKFAHAFRNRRFQTYREPWRTSRRGSQGVDSTRGGDRRCALSRLSLQGTATGSQALDRRAALHLQSESRGARIPALAQE